MSYTTRTGMTITGKVVPVSVRKGQRLKTAWNILRGRSVRVELPAGPAFHDLMDASQLAHRKEMRRWREQFARSLPKREPLRLSELQ